MGLTVATAPFSPGPYEVGTFRTPRFDSFTASVWYPYGNQTQTAPPNPKGLLPLLVFVSGFLQQEGEYNELLQSVASHGVVVVGLGWKYTSVIGLNYTHLAQRLDGVFAYGRSKEIDHDLMQQKPRPLGLPDARAVLLGAHSIGNHIIVRRLTSFGCAGVGGVVMIDPVDGADPYGFIKQFVIHPPAPVNFVTPAIHIETGLDPRRSSWLTPPCAPLAMSNDRFFHAWRGPIWQLNATGFGHNDVSDHALKSHATCPGSANSSALVLYRLTVAGAITAFVRGLFGVETLPEAAAVLNGTVAAPVAIEYAERGPTTQPLRLSCTAP